ncbi:MAG: DUF1028 domain-containing protein [Rhodobiaceae bacterium]|nr:DUF1028 domain-containing protein [Rhodobiaceae bacterium]
MTFSLLARDPESGDIGCVAATGNLAVGAWVLRANAAAGAAATQGYSVSPMWGDEALARLAAGGAAEDVLKAIVDPDPGRDYRQLTVLDLNGNGAAWSGSANTDAKGHRIGPNYVIAGNWLTDLGVLAEMEAVFLSGRSTDFGRRMLTALAACAAAGGDSRGTQSAAIRIVGRDRCPLDLRIDNDDRPIERLRMLYDIATNPPYSQWVESVPTLNDPHRY